MHSELVSLFSTLQYTHSKLLSRYLSLHTLIVYAKFCINVVINLFLQYFTNMYFFTTVPGSSINSWDSWFIFNLRKINTCYHTNTICAQKWTVIVGDNFMYILSNAYLEYWLSSEYAWKKGWVSLYRNSRILVNVHTWASVFLRHLSSMSCMVPSWAHTDSGSFPILGHHARSHAPKEEVIYSPNDSRSHFIQRLFPPTVPCQGILDILI